MRHLRRFNESAQNFKELKFDEDMMSQTSMIMNLIRNPYERNCNKLGVLIISTLDKEVSSKLFRSKTSLKDDPESFRVIYRDYVDLLILFITSVIDDKLMKEMFSNVIIHEGADLEEEFVSALEINDRVVLLLHSPDRGSSLRIQDDNHTIKFDEVLSIVENLCEIYNQKLK